ncbi:MAG: SPOR domain-containing protein [Gammaproteobacteria bacterium]|nr:SPOR domain-containing protein [Gammaproteobacteria bacterium]
MDQHLKQRLVGVAVIFSLAVIFLPMLLDGSGRQHDSLEISIPPPPVINSEVKVEEKVIELQLEADKLPRLEPFIVDESSDPPGQDAPVDVVKAEPQAEPEPAAETKPQPPKQAKTTEQTKPAAAKKQVGGESWVIQVGSFSDKNKAYTQRDQLRKSDLAAVFIEKFKHDGKLSYRVRMGPFITRKNAGVINNKLMAKYNIKGLVMRYER